MTTLHGRTELDLDSIWFVARVVSEYLADDFDDYLAVVEHLEKDFCLNTDRVMLSETKRDMLLAMFRIAFR